MSSENPYAAPEASNPVNNEAYVDHSSYYVNDGTLFIRHGAELPYFCVITGEKMTDTKRQKQSLFWASPWWALLILLNLLIYAIVYICVRKKFDVRYSISPKALKQRRIKRLGLFLGFISLLPVSFYCFSIADSHDTMVWWFLGFALMVVSLGGLLLMLSFTILRPKKHREGWISIRGVRQPFIDALNNQRKPVR